MYNALITKIRTRPLPGSDFLQLASCSGYTVLVGTNVQDGQLGIFFEEGGQLSPEFTTANDLIRRKDPVTGEKVGGMFEENRRIKAIKMRGACSEGFWCPLSYLDFTMKDAGGELAQQTLIEGYEFDEFNGISICNKYVTPQTARRASTNQKQGSPRKQNLMFKEHVDTAQFKRSIQTISSGAHIIISAKSHGTSGRRGRVLESTSVKYNWFGKIGLKLGLLPHSKDEWLHLDGTRRVVLQTRTEEDSYYKTDGFRQDAVRGLNLHKGESIYFELVGYTDNGTQIMPTHSTTEVKDKTLLKKYGPEMIYKYGCEQGTCKMLVYRIKQTNIDGKEVILSWNQMIGRCAELGLTPVHKLDEFIYDGDQEALAKRVNTLVNGVDEFGSVPDPIDPSHIMEGVVVLVESEFGSQLLKEKSFHFKLLEGIIKDNDDYVDTEESS